MKHYRQMIPTALLVAIIAVTSACASNTSVQRDPIRPVSDCMDLSRSHEVYTLSNKALIVKTGPKYYRVDLANDCGVLNSATLKFKVAEDKRDMQRMCGELGDQIISTNGMHCNVQRVTIIDKEQFKQLEEQSRAR